ncbi:hypothetical protein BH20ACT21_BH20ACT21_16010 [soil metagenome]
MVLFVALVAAAATFVVRDFHSAVAAEIETIERDAGLVAELVTVPLTSADFRLLAAFAPAHVQRLGGSVELVDASGRVLYQAGRALRSLFLWRRDRG